MVVNVPPKSPGIRARRQLETRRRITESATAIFHEVGYEAATMRAIAARANVATGTLFLHAPEKRSLLLMVLNNELERAGERAFATLDRSAIERIRREFFFFVFDESLPEVRWMTHWATTPDDVDEFAACVENAVKS